ncbi:PREDICTED: RUS1 family protein C16orf58 homolog [Eufriesea mexicana]|uniref:RUS1 family protein C16orf58 homolog n=1 Tax=Eufriesea mexicana TaxID=516756 RepID=UPI00083C1188|nr:PREDICTED: RUS1 family protein C16orf58 homolog [Eufriesea mexicana]
MHERLLFTEAYGSEKHRFFVKSKDEQSITELLSDTTRAKSFYFGFISIVKEIFLPQGYPDSVHPDYTPYQIWDTVQAFASTIMGTLTTHSIMQGVGVGEAAATPLAAAVTWILKDGTGMVGRIVFAWWNGTDLDGQCKKWRLFADILNDIAMGLELLLPYFSSYSLGILCISTAMKSIVGVAGGATRAALTQHQALQNNLADVSVKDASQETCINLVASLVGILILSIFHNGRYIMELYLFLVIVHLYANYSAVKALCLNSLNEDRLALIIKSYISNEVIPKPEEVNKKESVFLLTKPTMSICGFNIKIGVSLAALIKKDIILTSDTELSLKLFLDRKYLISIDVQNRTIFICLKKDAQPYDVLEAYFHACLCGLFICMSLKVPLDVFLKPEVSDLSYPLMRLYVLNKKYSTTNNSIQSSKAIESIYATNLMISGEYKAFISELENKGWITEPNLLPVAGWRFL